MPIPKNKGVDIDSVKYAAGRIDPEVKFTEEACKTLLKVPRPFLNTVLKGCVKWAKENNVLIIEDDYNGELRYSTHPMPCVQNYDTENTVYLGSFSKILLPSVRISYMVLPQKLTDEYNKIKKYTNQTASKTEQIALAKYINLSLIHI